MNKSEIREFLAKMRHPRLDALMKKGVCGCARPRPRAGAAGSPSPPCRAALNRSGLVKKINERCRKTTCCPHCGAFNGAVEWRNPGPGPLCSAATAALTNARTLLLAHQCRHGPQGRLAQAHSRTVQESFSGVRPAPRTATAHFAASAHRPPGGHRQKPPKKNGQSDKVDETADDFRSTFTEAIAFNPDIKAHLSKAQEDLTPLRVQRLFEAILPEVRQKSY